MIAVKREEGIHVQAMWLAVTPALIAALAYVLIQLHVLAVGDLAPTEMPAGIVYAAAGSYFLGGLLILLRRRWLWIIGAIINAVVMLIFVTSYLQRPAVMFSPGGMVSKAAQLLLEAGLIYLIVSDWRRARQNA